MTLLSVLPMAPQDLNRALAAVAHAADREKNPLINMSSFDPAAGENVVTSATFFIFFLILRMEKKEKQYTLLIPVRSASV